MTLTIRPAVAADAGTIIAFIKALAAYEKLSHEAKASEADILRDLFGEHPKAFCDIAEWDGATAGFALWFYTYSTFQGRHGIWLEDLFVDDAFRNAGLGLELMNDLRSRTSGRVEWEVSAGNAGAERFYRKLGAAPREGWTQYRWLPSD